MSDTDGKLGVYGVYEYADPHMGWGFSQWVTFVVATSSEDAVARSGLPSNYHAAQPVAGPRRRDLEETWPHLLSLYSEAKADLAAWDSPPRKDEQHTCPPGHRFTSAIPLNDEQLRAVSKLQFAAAAFSTAEKELHALLPDNCETQFFGGEWNLLRISEHQPESND